MASDDHGSPVSDDSPKPRPDGWFVIRCALDDEPSAGGWEPFAYAGFEPGDRFREATHYVLYRRPAPEKESK